MDRVKLLYELQSVELELEQKGEDLTQIEERWGRDDDLVQARTALDEENRQLAELERRQRTGEWEVEDTGVKIAALEDKLYGGSVKNPKELSSMQREVEHLKAQRREQEDRLLEVMEELEETRQELGMKSEETTRLEQEWHQEQEQLQQRRKELSAELIALEQKRGLILSQIDPTSLELYQALRQEKQGLAVAKVEQGRCQGCRIVLPMSVLQRTRVGQVERCTNCGRILYLE
jgi:hypothetical protein